MEQEIILTQEEIQVIDQYFKGEIGSFTATEEQQKHMMAVIDKAEALMKELDAYDELEDDLIQWFWDKYQAQTGNNA